MCLVEVLTVLRPQWVMDYLVEKKSITSIKGELLPILVRKQFLKRFKIESFPV